ncbi:MAG TPA: DUF4870 domain-containing protein [Terriglobales bacterium]|nr:DUF4870 domain-containing protein [Terriglobales bacterium]
MAFCSSCGGQVADGVTVCPACGHSTATTAAPAAPAVIPAVQTGSGLTDNVAGMLAYLSIIPAIIFLVMEPYNRNRFIRFHSFQSIFFCVASVVAWVALVIISKVLGIIPILGPFIAILLWIALCLASLIAWIILLIKASQGVMYKLPFIGDLAEKQANA